MDEHAVNRIDQWYATEKGQVVGVLFRGSARKGIIRTSRIVEVRVPTAQATDACPLAITKNGSAYLLGEPTPAFGTEGAAAFLKKVRLSGPSENWTEGASADSTVTKLQGSGRKAHPDPAEVQYAPLRGIDSTYDIRAWRDGSYQIFARGKLILQSAPAQQSRRKSLRSDWLQEMALLQAREFIDSSLPEDGAPSAGSRQAPQIATDRRPTLRG